MKGGCAKNAPNPPEPSTARPMKSALEARIEATRRCLPSMICLILTDLPLACARNARFDVINDPIIVYCGKSVRFA